jgi:uncharacterized protein (DUF885 family)
MTEMFALADRVVEGSAAANPTEATYMGVAGYDDQLTDFTSAAADARDAQTRAWLREVDGTAMSGDDDRLAALVLRERLGARRAAHDLGEHLRDCNVLGSPVQSARDVFSLMPASSEQDWHVIASRLEQVPASLATVRSCYLDGIAAGVVPARRQVVGAARTAAVAAGLIDDPAYFPALVAAYSGADSDLSARLGTAATAATSAYAEMAGWMVSDFAPHASEADAVGADRYRAMARIHCGIDLDLEETYAWGWEELGRITRRMNATAALLYGGVTPWEAMGRLDSDPDTTVAGAEQTLAWLQRITDNTIASFDGRYFDIPEPMRRCEAVLAPPGGASAPYYTPPSEDFSRPGRTWLPMFGQERFGTWWLTSVWYHEAVPGHHLQVAFTMLQKERLSRFQRVEFVSGHGEGWALYAERLMDELGYFDTPAIELGYLSNQALRAARVVLDIGLHLGLRIPADVDPALLEGLDGDPRGVVWEAGLARRFLSLRGLQPDAFAASEIDRYLGLPGQAISYKVGERIWLAAREDARAAEGDAFDLKAWHMRALALGSVGLEVLRAELARV